jgi:hypothetical protein
MKYFFLTLITLVQLSIFSPVYAGGAMGGGASEWTQLLNNAELLAVDGASLETSIATGLETANDLIGKPLATALINRAVNEVADETIRWANGGFDGMTPSLLVPDPEKEITKQGLITVKQALKSIPEDSVYGNSIFSAILDQNQDTTLEQDLKALSESNVPSIIQNNICNEEAITNLARSNVEDNAGNYTQEEFATEKRNLYARMCAEDPANNPEVAALLEDVNKQNPNLGGWDSWLNTTQGNNDYTRSELAKNRVAVEKGKKETIASNNMYLGVGSLSQTGECKKWLSTDVGEVPTCLEADIITAGKTVDAMISNAANAGLNRLSNLTGEGIAQAVVGFAVGRLVNGIATYEIPKGSPQSGTVSLSNISRVNKAVSAPKQDLADDPATKKSTLKPMLASLTAFLNSLSNLEKTDNLYLQDLRSYEAKINEGRACYQDLVTNKGLQASDSRVVSAFAFYDKRQATVTPVKNMLIEELDNISSARTLAEETSTAIKASNSSKEISTIFNDYQDTVDLNSYPTSQTEPTRRSEYTKNKHQVDNDTSSSDPSKLGEMASKLQECRNIATSLNNNNSYNWGN